MAAERDDGGSEQNGMSLRDYFAGQAAAGILACPNWANLGRGPWEREYSIDAYKMADAMLARRAETSGQP